jgi:hypothetical protein
MISAACFSKIPDPGSAPHRTVCDAKRGCCSLLPCRVPEGALLKGIVKVSYREMWSGQTDVRGPLGEVFSAGVPLVGVGVRFSFATGASHKRPQPHTTPPLAPPLGTGNPTWGGRGALPGASVLGVLDGAWLEGSREVVGASQCQRLSRRGLLGMGTPRRHGWVPDSRSRRCPRTSDRKHMHHSPPASSLGTALPLGVRGSLPGSLRPGCVGWGVAGRIERSGRGKPMSAAPSARSSRHGRPSSVWVPDSPSRRCPRTSDCKHIHHTPRP